MVTVGSSQRLGGRLPRTQREPRRDVLGRELELAPEWFVGRGGSEPEYRVYRALNRTGRTEPEDFTYQEKRFGGRLQKGGAVVDFVVRSPYVGINVQSLYYHARTTDQRAHDRIVQASLEGSGLRVEFISEEQAINDPDSAVADALAGVRSRGPVGL